MDQLKKGPGPNPFIDPKGYKEFIESNEKAFLEKLKSQKAKSHEIALIPWPNFILSPLSFILESDVLSGHSAKMAAAGF